MVGDNRFVPRDEWLKAHKALPAEEKRLTRQRDDLAALRRDLPWEAVTSE
jgi:predicted dithiol-disulfide oxidoreductase (DUF899 family)